jgi:hypothetical protein
MSPIRSLREISARWRSQHATTPSWPSHLPSPGTNLAGKYAHQLSRPYDVRQADPNFRFDLLDHSCEDLSEVSSPDTLHAQPFASQKQPPLQLKPFPGLTPSRPIISTPIPPPSLRSASSPQSRIRHSYPILSSSPNRVQLFSDPAQHFYPSASGLRDDELANISNALLGQQFTEMDSIITFDEED